MREIIPAKKVSVPFFSLLVLWAASAPAFAQKDLVKWSLTLDPPSAAPGATVLGRLEARVDPGWHMYSFTPVKNANIPSTLKLDGAVIQDFKLLQPTPKRALDEATAEQIGDFLVVEWRGKRRQILYRSE